MNILRVHFRESPYVGNEAHISIPPLSDAEGERRKRWTLVEDETGDVLISYTDPGNLTHTSRIPVSNVRDIQYEPTRAKPSLVKA